MVSLEEATALILVDNGRINIGWVKCRIRRRIDVKRCFRFLGYDNNRTDTEVICVGGVANRALGSQLSGGTSLHLLCRKGRRSPIEKLSKGGGLQCIQGGTYIRKGSMVRWLSFYREISIVLLSSKSY